ncbi:MAG: DUF4838 domain-containing protein [Candidatus Zipacnadales bacterium]
MLVILGLGLTWTAAHSELTLARNGKTDYVIALCSDAIPAEETAARELSEHLKLVTGAEFVIQQESAVRQEQPQIIVGPGQHFRAAFPEIVPERIGADGILLRTQDNRLYLAGDRPRGTLYAVYTFLEDVVGVRWWTATESFIPQKPTLEIPELKIAYAPKLISREAFYRGAFDGQFAPKLKLNGHFARIPEEYGGHLSILGWCHTFYQLLPPDKYFAAHPEWYSEIDGVRRHEGAQLCLTNDEMRAELTQVALQWLRENPKAGIISISQNDWGGACQCKACREIEAAEGSPSGPLIRFINLVAEEIEKEFPEVLVETLAYHYTRKAPATVKPRKNVVIRLCSIECNFAEPLETGPSNASFAQDLRAWSKIAPQLYIWDYVTNFVNLILPHPNHRVLAPNIRFFVNHGAIGLFEQGDAYSTCSDFPELRTWLLGHLMWNPSVDEQALTKEFMAGYYGAAAKPLQEYIDLIDDAVEREGISLRCFMPDTSGWLRLVDLNRAEELFDAAERAVAGQEVLLRRVRRARMPLLHVWLNQYHTLQRQAKLTGLPFMGPRDPKAATEEFIRLAHEFDVGQYREGRPFSEYEPMLVARFRDPAPPPRECEGLSETHWFDIQDNYFYLHGLGDWVQIVQDERASDSLAARMPSSHVQWATQYPVPRDIAETGPWHCYMVVGADLKQGGTGNVMTVGLYDREAKSNVMQQTVTVETLADGLYHTLDLGTHKLTEGMYFWAAPAGNEEAVEAVYVDRIFLIREPNG